MLVSVKELSIRQTAHITISSIHDVGVIIQFLLLIPMVIEFHKIAQQNNQHLLVGLMPVGYALFVDPVILRIPAASEEEVGQIPITGVNMILHYFLWLGSFMGVLTLPFWTIFAGKRLLKK